MTIRKGNLNTHTKQHPETRGWIIGSFIENDPLFKSDDFEVKWAEHKKGYVKKGLKTDFETKTVSLLIKGKFRINFFDGSENIKETADLVNLGDYVAYDAVEGDHIAEALEDCLVMVFRWPSKRPA